ncbi:MAG: sporulation transcription factor Spo0A [Firmicutes bacterium]|nr:sporulation transcription factor Spo0A [Bacillota bacterium]
MDIIKVIIVEDNIGFCEELSVFLNQEEDIKVVGTAKNGYEALDLITTLSADVVLLDLIMPYMDGLEVLERLSQIMPHKRPIIIVISSMGQDMHTQKALTLGADYYLAKPIKMDLLLDRIKLLCGLSPTVRKKGNEGNSNIENVVSKTLHQIGVPVHIKGYMYLRDAIVMAISNIGSEDPITKHLYPSIAKKHNTVPSRVERAIRNAIIAAFEKGNRKMLGELFVPADPFNAVKPVNREFIAKVADVIRLKLKIH